MGKRKVFRKSLVVVIITAGMALLSACSKQKAEAIMDAAKLFSLEAITALDRIEDLNRQSNSAYAIEDMQKDIIQSQLMAISDGSEVTTSFLNSLTQSAQPAPSPPNPMSARIAALKAQYITFSETFNALLAGNFFAQNAVLKTEKHAIKLTLQLVELAEVIESIQFQFPSRRAEIMDKIANVVADSLSTDALGEIAVDIVKLAKEETAAKTNALRQCLVAAERGRIVADLARNYKKMSLGEILNIVEGPMSFSIRFLGDGEISAVMTQCLSIKSTINEDPYWSKMIETEIE